MTETKSYNFDQALEMLSNLCDRRENQKGWIYHCIVDLFDPSTLTLEQWVSIADKTEKPKKWAFSKADEYGVL